MVGLVDLITDWLADSTLDRLVASLAATDSTLDTGVLSLVGGSEVSGFQIMVAGLAFVGLLASVAVSDVAQDALVHGLIGSVLSIGYQLFADLTFVVSFSIAIEAPLHCADLALAVVRSGFSGRTLGTIRTEDTDVIT